MKYHVLGLIDATCSCVVEAETPEAAITAAEEKLEFALCQQCSNKVTADNLYDFIVSEAEGGEKLISSEQDRNRTRITELEAGLRTVFSALDSLDFCAPEAHDLQRLHRERIENVKKLLKG